MSVIHRDYLISLAILTKEAKIVKREIRFFILHESPNTITQIVLAVFLSQIQREVPFFVFQDREFLSYGNLSYDH